MEEQLTEDEGKLEHAPDQPDLVHPRDGICRHDPNWLERGMENSW